MVILVVVCREIQKGGFRFPRSFLRNPELAPLISGAAGSGIDLSDPRRKEHSQRPNISMPL